MPFRLCTKALFALPVFTNPFLFEGISHPGRRLLVFLLRKQGVHPIPPNFVFFISMKIHFLFLLFPRPGKPQIFF